MILTITDKESADRYVLWKTGLVMTEIEHVYFNNQNLNWQKIAANCFSHGSKFSSMTIDIYLLCLGEFSFTYHISLKCRLDFKIIWMNTLISEQISHSSQIHWQISVQKWKEKKKKLLFLAVIHPNFLNKKSLFLALKPLSLLKYYINQEKKNAMNQSNSYHITCCCSLAEKKSNGKNVIYTGDIMAVF